MKCINDNGDKSACRYPVMFKEIKTPIGKCFYLYIDEKATTEQKFQGRNLSFLETIMKCFIKAGI